MTNIVEFPGLGLSFEISRVAFTIFGFPVYWYGVLIGLGMFLAILMCFRLAPSYGVDVDRMIDVILIGFVLAIVCGRLYYVLFVDMRYYSFFELIDLRSGGIAIYGGIIGAFVGALIGCRWRKVPILPMFDMVGMGFLLGQAMGRWGNFFNQEAFGDNTSGLLGMISGETTRYLAANQAALTAKGIYVDPYMPVHPTFLYESCWCLLGLVLLLVYQKRRAFHGELFLMYIFWYGCGRGVIEGLRTDPLMIGSFRVSQVLAILSAAAALVVWVIMRRKTRGQPLVIPEIPPHTATVSVTRPGQDSPTPVVISWPANEKAPTKAQRQTMALALLAEMKDEAATSAENEAGAPEKETPENEAPGPEKPGADGEEDD